MANSSDEITKGYVKEEILERIVKGEPTLQDLKDLGHSFATNPKERVEFVKELGNNLTPDTLHKLNSTIMKHADDITDKKDPDLVYRLNTDPIYKDLLILEAEKSGMKAEFDEKGNFIPPKLSSAIEDHYATLADKGGFYDKHAALSEDAQEIRIAKSVGFLLDAPLARNTEHYNNLSSKDQFSLEAQLRDLRTKKLDNKTSTPPQHKTYEEMGITETKLEDKEVQEKISKIKKAFSRPLINDIIDTTLQKLGSEKFTVDVEHKNKITAALSESLQNIPHEKLLENKEEIINNITKDLKEKQTALSKAAHALPGSSSCHISTENAKQVANDIAAKYPQNKQPENAIIKSSAPQDKEQTTDKKKNFLQEKVSHMRKAFSNVVVAAKNVKQFHSTLNKSIKNNKDQGQGR